MIRSYVSNRSKILNHNLNTDTGVLIEESTEITKNKSVYTKAETDYPSMTETACFDREGF